MKRTWDQKLSFWFVAQVHDHSPLPITTEGQGYFDELAADGKTAPKAAMTGTGAFFMEMPNSHGFDEFRAPPDCPLRTQGS